MAAKKQIMYMTTMGKWIPVGRDYAMRHVLKFYDRDPTAQNASRLNERLQGTTVQGLLRMRKTRDKRATSEHRKIPGIEATRAMLAALYPEHYQSTKQTSNDFVQLSLIEAGGG